MRTLTNLDLAWNLWKEGVTVESIAERCDIHRATVYRWIHRFRTCGLKRTKVLYLNAKKGRRRKRIDPVVKAQIYSLRQRHKGCCGQKLKLYLEKEYGSKVSLATIYRVLRQRWELSSKYKPQKVYGEVPVGKKQYDVVQADTVDFGDIYAYTFIDTYTREAKVVLKPSLASIDGARALEEVFRTTPQVGVLQTDGGSEFELEFKKVVCGYARYHRVSRPYRKNEQAYIESFNRTLRKECLGWLQYPARRIAELQRKVDKWLEYYHRERLHIGLGYLTPQEFMDSCRI